MSTANELSAMFAIDAEVRRLERDHIMELFESIKSDVYRHVPSGNDSAAVQEVFQRFEEAVASGGDQ